MGLGLYIHIPFCKQRCSYCDFVSYANKNHLMEPYIKALKKEISSKTVDRMISTIFIGGGTPTALNDELFEDLLHFIKENIKLTQDYEFTVEANPESVTRQKAKIMKMNGVNRISMGLQATNDILLKNIGRIHDLKTFNQAYKLLKEEGFENINLDLITGLPGQTPGDIIKTLEFIEVTDPLHISVYSLILEEGTPMYLSLEKGIVTLPTEDADREFQDIMREGLERLGYIRYEISNYAKLGFECIHNINYWRTGEYVGVGVSASGFDNSVRYVNTSSMETYINTVEAGEDPASETHINTFEDDVEEFIFMGLRMTEGTSAEEFYQRFNADLFDFYGEVIKKYIESGHLKFEKGRLSLTSKGFDISNYILSDFMLTKYEYENQEDEKKDPEP